MGMFGRVIAGGMVVNKWLKYRTPITLLVMLGLIVTLMEDVQGWPPIQNTDLGDSYASFIGEGMDDHSGISVACAGDVNGDGYDDILIGARGNDEGGTDAGQIYLILGSPLNWSMDFNLSRSDASFIGNARNQAGGCVAGAGDVNGDGYDDFLIGAHLNSDAGTYTGRTYLIFGKASGWSMDTDIDDSNASFGGENVNDMASNSIAGVGDVNGDGFDDILIGARYNDEGGNNAGQTYLILGRDSGWSMNISLSNANASFWGEKPGDNSGTSVAGVGDVNKDGFDDILIGAPRNNDSGLDSGKTYLILGKKSGWLMDTNLSSANASFIGESENHVSGYSVEGAGDVNGDAYDDILIGAIGASNGPNRGAGRTYCVFGKSNGWRMDVNLSTSNASFIGEGGSDRAGWSVAGAGDVNNDGYDDILIGAYMASFHGFASGRTYLILGNSSSLSMNTDLSQADASFWGEKQLDGAGCSVASAGDVNRDGFDDILIGAFKNDEGSINSGQTYLILYSDGIPPHIENDMTGSYTNTGDEFTFATVVTDNIGISHVNVEYWFGINGSHINDSMNYSSGELWTNSITIPFNSIETLHYFIYAEDISNNTITTAVKDVVVRDIYPPVLRKDETPLRTGTGNVLKFSITLTDNVGIRGVWINYWYGNETHLINASLSNTSQEDWIVEINVRDNNTTSIHYVLIVEDLSGNVITVGPRVIVVTDDDAPIILSDNTSSNATTGETLTFSLLILDNIAIGMVMIRYHYNEGTPHELSLQPSQDDIWEGSIQVDHTLKNLHYIVIALDQAGNLNTTSKKTVNIIDNDLPELQSDFTTRTATTGDPLLYRMMVVDNIGIDSVVVLFHRGDFNTSSIVLERVDTDMYSISINLSENNLESLTYIVTVTDLYGNSVEGDEQTIEVIDDDPPSIIYEASIIEAIKGLPLSLNIDATDNIGIARAFLVMRYGDENVDNLTMEVGEGYKKDIEVPRHPDGDLYFHFSATDDAGNWISTEEYSISLVNLAPVVDLPDAWIVTEGLDTVLDLEPHISDGNDDLRSLSISTDDPSVSVVDLTLRARYDTWLEDWTINVTVSDGEDETLTRLSIEIENINDAPVIVSIQPENGSYFMAGQFIEFFVEYYDEDGDTISITWASDDRIIGNNESFEYGKLQPGKREVKITLSDGEIITEQEIILIIKEEDIPSFSLTSIGIAIIILLGLVIIGVIIYVMRLRN